MLKDLPQSSTLAVDEWDWEPDTIRGDDDRMAAVQRRVDRLEFALEAKQAELQSVIDHYEMLLEECQTTPEEPDTTTDGPVARIVSTVTEQLS